MNMHWGYFPRDNMWKPPKGLLHHLSGCVSGGGNYLLDVGPRADGTIPGEAVRRLRRVGEWLKVHGEAIYGAGRGPFNSGTAGVVTACPLVAGQGTLPAGGKGKNKICPYFVNRAEGYLGMAR